MKRFIFCISFVATGMILLVHGCKPVSNGETAVITGSVLSVEHSLLTFVRVDTVAFTPVDSIKPGRDGSFSISLNLQKPEIFHIRYKGKVIAPLVIHPGDQIMLNIRNDSVELSGGQEAGRFNAFRQKLDAYKEMVDSLGAVLSQARDFENYDAIRAGADSSYYAMMQKAKTEGITWLKANPTALSQLMVINSKVQQAFLFDQLTDSSWFFYTDSVLQRNYPVNPHVMANHRRMDQLRKSLSLERRARINMQAGNTAPPLVLPGLNGKPLPLNTSKSKYTLVFFWAPTDGLSRKASQELKNLHEQYKSRGLDVFAVSFDQFTDRWAAAVNLDKLWWTNVNDTLLLNSPVAKSWNIQKLPVFVLVDRQGKIIDRFPAVRPLADWLALKIPE